jgi:methanogenic corrinoid protein MtbC1
MEAQRLSQAQLAVTSTATAGDTGTLYYIVSGLLDEGIPLETILFDLLIPTAAHIGRRWQQGDYLIAEEHAATAALETVVSLLAGSFDQPEEGLHVVAGTVDGDAHSLPTRAVTAHLLYLGYRTTFLGASLPAPDLEEYLAEEGPAVALLSAAMTMHLPAGRAAIRACHDVGVPVIVGGRAFGEGGPWAPILGADAWVASPRDVAPLLESWDPDPARAENQARNPSPDLQVFSRSRPIVLARSYSELVQAVPNGNASRMLSELNVLLGALEGAMLVGEPAALVDTLRWQRETFDAHGFVVHEALVAAARSQLNGDFPQAGTLLDSAVEAAAAS